MYKFIIYFLVATCFGSVFMDPDVESYPDQVISYPGKSYNIYLKVKEGIEPAKCYAESEKGIKYSLDLKTSVKATLLSENVPSSDVSNIYSLGNNICGLQLYNETYTGDFKYWTLTITDSNNKNYTGKSKVVVTNTNFPKEFYKKEIFIPYGDDLTITCINDEWQQLSLEATVCEIYNPHGDLVTRMYGRNSPCSYLVKTSRIADFGTWKCLLGFKHVMQQIERIVQVTQVEKDVVSTWQKESDTSIEIGCKVTNVTQISTFCQMTRPDGRIINVYPGSASDRYTSIGTSYENRDVDCVCTLQIKKPLQASEYGVWRCQQYGEVEKSYIGGFISIAKDGKEIKPAPIIPKEILVHVNGSLTIECQVFYASPYCFMRSPSGVFYPVDDNRSTLVGRCIFIKELVQGVDNGTWTCGFAKSDGQEDEVFPIEVRVIETPTIHAAKAEVSAKLNSDAYLKCTTKGVGDFPLQYCRFLSPEGNMYFIKDTSPSNSRIHYDGRGMKYGECGIRVKNVKETDKGIWSCITRIGYNFEESEIYTNILLEVTPVDDDLTTASSIGIAVGAIAVVGIFGFIGFKKYQQYRRVRPENISFRRDDETRSSNENIVAVNVNASEVSYNTVN